MSRPPRAIARSRSSPPDRGHISTEQRNPRSMHLHALNTRQLVCLMRAENNAVLRALQLGETSLIRFIDAAARRFDASGSGRRPGRLIYFGAGTSGRLGVLDASEAPPTFSVEPGRIVGIIAGGDRSLRKSSEGREDELLGAAPAFRALRLTRRDTVLGIAAGGTTPYVLGGLRLAKRCGCLTGLITCARVPRPPGVDHLIVLPTGPEVIAGSTRLKAGTATKIALNTISTALMVHSGRVYENLMVDLRATNDKLRDRAARIVASVTGLRRRASLHWLDASGGAVKVALVMAVGGLDRASAERLLDSCNGRVDKALERVNSRS